MYLKAKILNNESSLDPISFKSTNSILLSFIILVLYNLAHIVPSASNPSGFPSSESIGPNNFLCNSFLISSFSYTTSLGRSNTFSLEYLKKKDILI